MNARRRASRTGWQVSPQWFVLSAYWLISGYAQRSWRAIAWFLGVAAVSSLLFLDSDLLISTVEVINGEKQDVWRLASASEAFQFSVQSMVSFFSPSAKRGSVTSTKPGRAQKSLVHLWETFPGRWLLSRASLFFGCVSDAVSFLVTISRQDSTLSLTFGLMTLLCGST